MKPTIQDSAKIIGIIGSTAAVAITAPIMLTALTSMMGGIVTSSLIADLKKRKIKRWFIEPDPDDLNHDIKKLFVSSIDQALYYIIIKYEDTLPDEDELKEAKDLIKNLRKDISEKLSVSTNQYIDDDKIRDYISSNSTEDISKELDDLQIELANTKFSKFLITNLSLQIQICFLEGLKDETNRAALIAYHFSVLHDISKNINKLLTQNEKKHSFNATDDEIYNPLSQIKLEELKKVHAIINDEATVKISLEESLIKILKSLEEKQNQILIETAETSKKHEADLRKIAASKIRWIKYPTTILVLIGLLIFGLVYLQPFNSSIIIYGWNKEAPLPHAGSASLQLHVGEIKVSEINSRGEAKFENIPGLYRWLNKVKVEIENKDSMLYYLKDSVVRIRKEKTSYLQFSVQGIEALEGEIIDGSTNEPVVGAEIKIADIITRTDKNGNFKLSIPMKKQKIFQEVTISKKGYNKYRQRISMVNTQKFRRLLFQSR